MKIDWKRPRWAAAIFIAIALGFLEAAWTGPGRGGPTNTWMGIFAIFVIFGFITFPKLWWIPLLATIEEITHFILSTTLMAPSDLAWNVIILRQFFNHWSVAYVGFNLYPYLLFPLLTLLGEILYRHFKAKRQRLTALPR